MYEIIKSVIRSQRFELSDMLRKIDTVWLRGQISDSEQNELAGMARENADPELSNTLIDRISVLEKEVENIQAKLGGTTIDEWPVFQPHHRYKKGDKISFNGAHYICKLTEGVNVTTWSPTDYPLYWQIV